MHVPVSPSNVGAFESGEINRRFGIRTDSSTSLVRSSRWRYIPSAMDPALCHFNHVAHASDRPFGNEYGNRPSGSKSGHEQEQERHQADRWPLELNQSTNYKADELH